MHEYDVTLKSVLTRRSASLLSRLSGAGIARWHNVELPLVRHRRADLLGESADGRLLHFELESTNRAGTTLRMLEYLVAIHRKFGRYPEQMVLYVGKAPLRMKSTVLAPGLRYECRYVDIRQLDAEPLLESAALEDNVIAILARLRDAREAVRMILRRIACAAPEDRDVAFGELLVLAGLRELDDTIEQETERMPILDDIMDHKVIGRERRAGMAIGERELIQRMMARRFGPVPGWATERLAGLSRPALEDLGLRLLDATSLEELFSGS